MRKRRRLLATSCTGATWCSGVGGGTWLSSSGATERRCRRGADGLLSARRLSATPTAGRTACVPGTHMHRQTQLACQERRTGLFGAPTTLSLGMLCLSEHVTAVDGAYSGDDVPSAGRRRLDDHQWIDAWPAAAGRAGTPVSQSYASDLRRWRSLSVACQGTCRPRGCDDALPPPI